MNIRLRPFTIRDKYALQVAANNRKISLNLRNTFPHPYTLKDAEIYINGLSEKSPQTDFVIEVDEKFAGRIALDPKDDIYSTAVEIGYWIAEPYWGKGIATIAIGLARDHFRQHYNRPRLFAVCFESNVSSRKALEKNGFELECIRLKAVVKNDVILNDCVYVIIFNS